MPGDIDFAYQLANSAEFRDQLAYALTPLVGTILEDNGDGTYDVDTSQGDGGELIARALDQRTYGVGDFVWCMLAFQAADSAIILGSYNPAPTSLAADEIHAAGSAGLSIEDDGGNLGVFVEDGGQVGIGTSAPAAPLHVYQNTNTGVPLRIENPNGGNAASVYVYLIANGGTPEAAQIAKYGNAHASYANRLSLYNGEGDIWLHTDGVDILVTDAGNVGIAEAAPDTRLHLDGAITLTEQASTPTAPTTADRCRIYMKADKLIIQYDDGANTRYKYLDLTGTSVTWVHTTTAP